MPDVPGNPPQGSLQKRIMKEVPSYGKTRKRRRRYSGIFEPKGVTPVAKQDKISRGPGPVAHTARKGRKLRVGKSRDRYGPNAPGPNGQMRPT